MKGLGAPTSKAEKVADMKPEMVQQSKKEAASSRHELAIAQQTTTAVGENIKPSSYKLLEEVLSRENLLKALKRVQAKKGAAGIDGMTVDELPDYLRQHWPRIREQLLNAGQHLDQPLLVVL